ncbi:MAG: hypothetical protein QW568_03075 [Candidatus Anstonellaceae archaeon]
MRHILAAAIIALASLLLFGCIGDSRPSACAGVPASKLANCVYINAVSEQNPFYCYSIPDSAQRATCLKDAADPSMKKALERSLPEQRNSIFGQPEAPEEQPPAPPAKPPAKPSVPCDYANLTQRDSCIKDMAANKSAISNCEQIQTQTIREHCISEIAQKTKNPSSCNALAVESNRNLCNLYSQG